MASVWSDTIVSFLNVSIKFENSALEIVSLVSVIEIVNLAQKKKKTSNEVCYLVVITKNFNGFIEVLH